MKRIFTFLVALALTGTIATAQESPTTSNQETYSKKDFISHLTATKEWKKISLGAGKNVDCSMWLSRAKIKTIVLYNKCLPSVFVDEFLNRYL